jgi:serine/threonine-protein kinase
MTPTSLNETSIADHVKVPKIGAVLAKRYRIDKILGQGGFSVVFLATDLSTPQQVAIKVPDPDSLGHHNNGERFLREIATLSKFQHPCTMRVHGQGETDSGLPFMVMELCNGPTLARALQQQGPFSSTRVRHIAEQILGSLSEAHSQGFLHRDIKPENVVLVGMSRERDVVKLIDFGLAKSLDEERDKRLTQNGLLMCSPLYVAPERVTNGHVSGASDIYSLGIMLIELLDGVCPIQGASSHDAIYKHISPVPVPMGQRALGSPLAPILRRATAKSPADRYRTCGEMLADLARVDSVLRTHDAQAQPGAVPAPAVAAAGRGGASGPQATSPPPTGPATGPQGDPTKTQRETQPRRHPSGEAQQRLDSAPVPPATATAPSAPSAVPPATARGAAAAPAKRASRVRTVDMGAATAPRYRGTTGGATSTGRGPAADPEFVAPRAAAPLAEPSPLPTVAVTVRAPSAATEPSEARPATLAPAAPARGSKVAVALTGVLIPLLAVAAAYWFATHGSASSEVVTDSGSGSGDTHTATATSAQPAVDPTRRAAVDAMKSAATDAKARAETARSSGHWLFAEGVDAAQKARACEGSGDLEGALGNWTTARDAFLGAAEEPAGPTRRGGGGSSRGADAGPTPDDELTQDSGVEPPPAPEPNPFSRPDVTPEPAPITPSSHRLRLKLARCLDSCDDIPSAVEQERCRFNCPSKAQESN